MGNFMEMASAALDTDVIKLGSAIWNRDYSSIIQTVMSDAKARTHADEIWDIIRESSNGMLPVLRVSELAEAEKRKIKPEAVFFRDKSDDALAAVGLKKEDFAELKAKVDELDKTDQSAFDKILTFFGSAWDSSTTRWILVMLAIALLVWAAYRFVMAKKTLIVGGCLMAYNAVLSATDYFFGKKEGAPSAVSATPQVATPVEATVIEAENSPSKIASPTLTEVLPVIGTSVGSTKLVQSAMPQGEALPVVAKPAAPAVAVTDNVTSSESGVCASVRMSKDSVERIIDMSNLRKHAGLARVLKLTLEDYALVGNFAISNDVMRMRSLGYVSI